MTPLRLKVIGTVVLGLSMLAHVIGTGSAWAEPFPRAVGNWWEYGVKSAAPFEKHLVTVQREQLFNGFNTWVLQGTNNGQVVDEWYWVKSTGSSIAGIKLFGLPVGMTTTDVSVSFNQLLHVATPDPRLNEILNSVGTASIVFGGGPPTNVPYTATSKVVRANVFDVTPAGIFNGFAIETSLTMPGPTPFNGTLFVDTFLAQDVGPTRTIFDGFGFSKSKFLKDTNVDLRQTTIFSAILPTDRGTVKDGTVTTFGSLVNGGDVTATSCGLFLLPGMDGLRHANFVYRQASKATNEAFGPDYPVMNIPAHDSVAVVIAIQPTEPGHKDYRFVWDCLNTGAAQQSKRINSFGVFTGNTPPPDIVMLIGTILQNGIVDVPGCAQALTGPMSAAACTPGTGIFVAAATNLGVDAPITVRARPLDPVTPVVASVCETNPTNGACLGNPGPEVTVQWSHGQNRTFGFFVQGTRNIAFDPGRFRLDVEAVDQLGNRVGGAGAAVRTVIAGGGSFNQLVVEVIGEGEVKIDPPGTVCKFPDPNITPPNPQLKSTVCVEFYDKPTTVTLTATPAAGKSLTGFTGGCQGVTNPCKVDVNPPDKSVQATFK